MVLRLVVSNRTSTSRVYRLLNLMSLKKVNRDLFDVKCGCCNETCLDCPRIYFSYWGKTIALKQINWTGGEENLLSNDGEIETGIVRK